MRAWDSVTEGVSLRPGSAALAIFLIGLLLMLAPVSQRLENAFFDMAQRLGKGAATSDIVLVDTRGFRGKAGSAWEAQRFPDLLETLSAAGARLVIPTEAPPLTTGLPDSRQLAALADLDRRNRANVRDEDAEALTGKWAEIRQRSELHSRTVEAVRQLRNLIVGVPTFDTTPGTTVATSGCQKHLFTAGQDAADSDSGARFVRAVTPPPEELCSSALGAGHLGFWADEDGTVRRLDLLVDSSGTLVQSAVFKAALALSFPSGKPVSISGGRIAWDSHEIRTSGGPATLLRFYSARDTGAAFETVAAEDLLQPGTAKSRIAGKVAVLGDGTVGPGEGYDTPLGADVAPAVMLATGLSNLLSGDYLVRPTWMPWLETALVILAGFAVWLWGGRISAPLAALAGVCTAVILLGAEAYLLREGLWAELTTVAIFAAASLAVIRFIPAGAAAGTSAGPVTAEPSAAAAPRSAAHNAGDELDLAFSMLRHQQPTEQVKNRLYEIALEHARRRDLAKAERVLGYLAGIDPDYRNAGEKLKKLAGMRVAEAAPAPANDAPSQSGPMPAPVVTARPSATGEDLSGQTIGRYEIERIIGRGAMATVYMGRDPKINRRVAIKIIALAEEFSDTDLANARTQFLREAESAGRLNHPNIISIYDAGEEGAVAYLAMEYFVGKPLSFYTQQGQLLPPQWVLEITARAAEALHYAHQQHVVHRDVKPANLLYDAETDTLKITDFGIARLTDSSRTKTGIILGTPSYMSPEQLAGAGVTGQSDLFSLGITLYQLLTGAPPFRADSIPRLMQKIAHEPHPSVRQIREDLPEAIDKVIDRALAKAPDERFPNGRAMALALRDCCSSFAVYGERQSA